MRARGRSLTLLGLLRTILPNERFIGEGEVHHQHPEVGARSQGVEVGVLAHEGEVAQARGDGAAEGVDRLPAQCAASAAETPESARSATPASNERKQARL